MCSILGNVLNSCQFPTICLTVHMFTVLFVLRLRFLPECGTISLHPEMGMYSFIGQFGISNVSEYGTYSTCSTCSTYIYTVCSDIQYIHTCRYPGW